MTDVMHAETWEQVHEQEGAVYIEGPVMAVRTREVEGRGPQPDYVAPVLTVWDGQAARSVAYRQLDVRTCPPPPPMGQMVRCCVRLSVWRERVVTSGVGTWEVLDAAPARVAP